jgi:hypothetical protein
MDSYLGAAANNVITNNVLATDAIGNAQLATSAINAIQSGLALAATALSTSVWTNTLATNIGTTNTNVTANLDTTISSRLASASYTAPPSAATISIQVASDLAIAHGAGLWETATGFAVPGSEMTLTSAYDAAKTAATQTSVDNLQADATDIKTTTDKFVFTVVGQVDANALAVPAGATPPTVAQIADGVWDELLSGHTLPGSAAVFLAAAGGAADPWLTALPGAYVVGSAGYIIGTGTASILAAVQGTEVIQVASPNVLGNLVLTQGDSYDGIANPKAQWTVTTDYTSGWSVVLTIRDKDDAVVYTTSGTVESSTVIAVAIAAPTGLDMTGCPGQWQGKFDVQLTKDGSKKTIALGVVYINEDQTR